MSFLKFKFSFFIILFLLEIGLFFLAPHNLQAADPINYSIKIDQFSPSFKKEKKTLFLVSSEDENFLIKNNSFQKIVKTLSLSSKSLLVKTGEINPKHNPPSKDLIANTPFLNLDDPQIKKTALSLKRKKNPIPQVEKFVYKHIDKKINGIPFVSAKNIIRNKSGDCTEHTVLTIALLRRLKIPARAILGLIYAPQFKKNKNVFVFHMWAEAYYKKKWHLVDATRPGKKKINHYLALTEHNLKSSMPLNYLKMMASLKNLKIKYLKNFPKIKNN